LFTYPSLMAADILLYQSDLVPVGADQKQHLELSRNLAERVNGVLGPLFVVPEPYIPKVGSRVMSLQDPTSKMSKSDAEDTFISLLDPPATIRKKLRRAVTDSETVVRYDPEHKPGVSNLLSIVHALTGRPLDAIAADFDGKGYGAFKDAVADAVIAELEPIQAKYHRVSADRGYLNQVMRSGAERAGALAERTMAKVRKKLGLAPLSL
ncbi:MAG: tryptophan--tRNA ligase, partial [Clostridiales bacterium]|nr:tryptophan--tRNA ligase [Clostridiales bacterium]